MKDQRVRAALVLLLVAAAVYGLRLAILCFSDEHPRGSKGPIPESPALQSAAAAADAAFQTALQKISELRDKRPPLPNADKLRANRSTSDCGWRASVRRSNADLSDEFLMGAVSHEQLMRHDVLNPLDRPLCPEEEKDLEGLVSEYNRIIGPLLSAFRDLRSQETVALIESGAMSAWSSGDAADDSEVADAATVLIKMGIEAKDAQEMAAKSRRRLRTPPGSHMIHDGRVYLMPPASSLPRSVACYDQVKFVVVEQMQIVLSWFVAREFMADSTQLTRLYERVSSRPIE